MTTKHRLDEIRDFIANYEDLPFPVATELLDEITRLRALVPPAELMEQTIYLLQHFATELMRAGLTGNYKSAQDLASRLSDYAQRINQGNGK